MKKQQAVLGMLLLTGLLMTGCGKNEKADSAAANSGAENGAGKTVTELVTEVVEDVEEKVNEYRDVTKLSLDDRRTLFQNYAKIFAGEGINGNYIICNQDGTVTLIGYEYETLQKPRTWTDIKQVAATTNYVLGLKKDGTVVASELCDGDNEVAYTDAEQWTDIVQIAANQLFAAGLKSDGTVVWTNHDRVANITQPEQISEWTDIVQIASMTGTLFGLKKDGTVVFNHYNEEASAMNGAAVNATLAPVERWTGVQYLTVCEGTVAALTTDGKLLYLGCEYDEEKGSNPAEWENIVGIVATRGSLFGLLEDGTIVGSEKVDAHCAEYDNVAGMHSDSSGSVVALTYDGRLLGEEKFCDLLGEKRESLNVKSFVQYDYALGVDNDGKIVNYSMSDKNYKHVEGVTGALEMLRQAGGYSVLYPDGTVELIVDVKGDHTDAILSEIKSWKDIKALKAGQLTKGSIIMAMDGSGKVHFIDAFGNSAPVDTYEGPSKDITGWRELVFEIKANGAVQTHKISGASGICDFPDVNSWTNMERLFVAEHTLFGITADGGMRCIQLTAKGRTDSKVNVGAVEQFRNVKDLCVSNGTVAAITEDGKLLVSEGPDETLNRLVKSWENEKLTDVRTLQNGNILALTEDGRVLETILTGIYLEEE